MEENRYLLDKCVHVEYIHTYVPVSIYKFLCQTKHFTLLISHMTIEAIQQQKEHWYKTQKTWIPLVPNCTSQNTLRILLSFSIKLRYYFFYGRSSLKDKVF